MALVEFDARRALLVGGMLSLFIASCFLAFDTEASPFFLDLRPPQRAHSAPPLIGVGAAFLLGMGLGSIMTLVRSNRHRMRAVLRPNKGRIISAVILSLLVPYAQFWGLPIFFGFALSEFFARFTKYAVLDQELVFILFLWLGVALPVAYVVSCLIISGVRSRFVRVALFGQVWLAVYGGTILAFGFYSGNM